MTNLSFDFEISPSTRFAEGFYTGLKLAIVHSLTYAPYYSKEESLRKKTSFFREYNVHMAKTSLFYTVVLGCTYAIR